MLNRKILIVLKCITESRNCHMLMWGITVTNECVYCQPEYQRGEQLFIKGYIIAIGWRSWSHHNAVSLRSGLCGPMCLSIFWLCSVLHGCHCSTSTKSWLWNVEFSDEQISCERSLHGCVFIFIDLWPRASEHSWKYNVHNSKAEKSSFRL